MATIKVTGEIPDGYCLFAEIEYNEKTNKNGYWMPWGDDVNFNQPKVVTTTRIFSAVGGNYAVKDFGVSHWAGNVVAGAQGIHTGFLSLVQTNVVKVEAPGWENVPSTAYDTGIDVNEVNRSYFEGAYDQFGHRRKRGYSIVPNPLYTRAKELVTRTGYTGNIAPAAMAYGYDDENGGPSKKGMRGVFVYNSHTCKQIFLPIGFAGHGHRKVSSGWVETKELSDDVLRYAQRSRPMGSNNSDAPQNNMPLLFDLYKRPGAVYRTKYYKDTIPQTSITRNGKEYEFDITKYSSAFDINYFSFGVEGYGNNGTQDACFIRTIVGDEMTDSKP